MSSAVTRSVQHLPARFGWRPTDGSGRLFTPAGQVTLTVTRSDGTPVVTDVVVPVEGSTAEYLLAATHTQILDDLVGTWKIAGAHTATTRVAIVGGLIATIPELESLAPRIGVGQWTAEQIVTAASETTDEFEKYCGVAFRPRYCLETITTDIGPSVDLWVTWPEIRTVRSATITYPGSSPIALTAGERAAIPANPHRTLTRTDGNLWPAGCQVAVGYEHGYTAPSARLQQAFATRVLERLQRPSNALPSRATSTQLPEGGTVQLLTPNSTRVTGNPEIDVVLWDETRRVLMS